MALEVERECTACGESHTFYRIASTELHLGEKTKWAGGADACDHRFVKIDGAVDTGAA
jgi:hypothetical protein